MGSVLKAAVAFTAVGLFSTPAFAGEARVEARGGIVFNGCCSNETIGLAVGYDADVSETVFIGAEAVVDTDFDFGSPLVGVNARLGAKLGDGRLFATGGYVTATEGGGDDLVAGAGYQHNIGPKGLVSVQYQRFLDLEVNRVTVGFGVRF